MMEVLQENIYLVIALGGLAVMVLGIIAAGNAVHRGQSQISLLVARYACWLFVAALGIFLGVQLIAAL